MAHKGLGRSEGEAMKPHDIYAWLSVRIEWLCSSSL